jgi:hypothetical protein
MAETTTTRRKRSIPKGLLYGLGAAAVLGTVAVLASAQHAPAPPTPRPPPAELAALAAQAQALLTSYSLGQGAGGLTADQVQDLSNRLATAPEHAALASSLAQIAATLRALPPQPQPTPALRQGTQVVVDPAQLQGVNLSLPPDASAVFMRVEGVQSAQHFSGHALGYRTRANPSPVYFGATMFVPMVPTSAVLQVIV